VFVQSPAAGAWTVEVIASRIAQDAHLATPQVDATYALCCVGGTGVATGGSSPYAASAIVGTGCAAITSIPLPRTFCEQFGPFDLAWSALRFHPNGIGGWDATPCAGCFARGYGGNLGLGDDALARNLALGFAFPLPGGGYTSAIDIDANGWVGLVPYTHAASDPTETVAELLANPRRIAVCWDNLDPSAGGGVYFDPLPGVALVTWAAVPEFLAGGANTAQLQLYPNGEFVLAWQAMSIADCIVGHSVGGGVPDPGARNLSNAAGITLLTLGASALPMLGTSVALTTTNYPAGALLSVQALGLVGYDPGLDLGGYGMPGCRQYARIDATGAQIPAGGQSVSLLSVPNYPSLLGLPVHAQSFAFAPGINTAGVVSSNGVRMLVGH
jgi:hypothetical protein